MKDTRFNSRSSEWMGDMTVWLRENAEDNREQMDRLYRNLRKARKLELTPRQQLMLELYFDENMKVGQIAEMLHVNPSTVSRTLRRAKERLRRCLQYTL